MTKPIESYLGLPFKSRGRDRNGIDCWGLTKLWLEEQHGFSGLPDYRGEKDVFKEISAAMQSDEWGEVKTPENGEVLVMHTAVGNGRTAPLHVGVMVSGTHVLNIDQGQSSVCLPVKHRTIASRVAGFWRRKANS